MPYFRSLSRWPHVALCWAAAVASMTCSDVDQEGQHDHDGHDHHFGSDSNQATSSADLIGSGDEGASSLPSTATGTATDTATSTLSSGDTTSLVPPYTVDVLVTLDGLPLVGAPIYQGGIVDPLAFTDAKGRAKVVLSPLPLGQSLGLIAADPSARTRGVDILPMHHESGVTIALQRFSRQDNLNYRFAPGHDIVKGREGCNHCHGDIVEDWSTSGHRFSANRSTLHDIYDGTARAVQSKARCEIKGGSWVDLNVPGQSGVAPTCKVAPSVAQIEALAPTHGQCAACHAPAIDGVLVNRDLHDASGIAFDDGVVCDLCHKVESIVPGAAPGVSGWLRVLRPSDPWPNKEGSYLPLAFGPYNEVSSFAMGAVQRSHFREGAFCGGCHQLEMPLPTSASKEARERWPNGKFPVHSTYEEWQASPLAPDVSCISCHMPPDSHAINGITHDHGGSHNGMALFDRVTGWPRPPGDVRHHTFVGPRSAGSAMLSLAADLQVDKTVQGRTLNVDVSVKNRGPGHALPTGEPLRSIVLLVEATCMDQPLPAVAGDVIPDFGGALAIKDASQSWEEWPEAHIGQVIRVVTRSGSYRDYDGVGRFASGQLPAEQKGLPMESARGSAVILGFHQGKVVLDRHLPRGEVAYLGEAPARPGDPSAKALAGHPGFAFARVLIDEKGNKMVPHAHAVDVVSDNRLSPGQAFVSHHRFETTCEQPKVVARLVYRPYPLELARQRGWDNLEVTMVEVVK